MSKAKTKKVKLPTILSYTRSIDASVGTFYSLDSENPSIITPILVTQETQLGVISNYKDVTSATEKKLDMGNPQTVDIARLPIEHDTLEVRFNVMFSGNSIKHDKCNDKEYKAAHKAFIDKYIVAGGYTELAKRYVNSILGNGRETATIWRNNDNAEKVSTTITTRDQVIKEVSSIESDDYNKLIERVATALKGEERPISLRVRTNALLDYGMQVHPSQEFADKDSNSKLNKSRVLAITKAGKHNNVAVFHSQKLTNAIHKIDNWHGVDKSFISVSPAGLDKNEYSLYRESSTKRDFYTLMVEKMNEFTEQMTDSADSIDGDAHFLVANYVHGGVFGGK